MAVTVAVWLLRMVPAVAVKVVLVDPEATVTDAGTVSEVVLLDKVTAAPPVPAAFDRVTVQLALPFELSEVGLHDTALTTVVADSVIDAVFVEPFSLAVTTAVWPLLMVPAVALKVVAVEPEGTVTEPGTVSSELLLESETESPPAPAARFSVTVQSELADDVSEVGLHERVLMVAGVAVIVPPVAVSPMKRPLVSTPIALVTPTGTLVADDDTVTATTATTPFAIVVEFWPVRIQE